MLEKIRILKADLEILKATNLKLLNAKSDQEEIHELILKSLTNPQKNNGQNSCSTGKKRKGAVQGDSSEETTDNIIVIMQNLKKDNGIKIENKKEQPIELHGEFKNLRPPMFDGESEEAAEAWLLNMK